MAGSAGFRHPKVECGVESWGATRRAARSIGRVRIRERGWWSTGAARVSQQELADAVGSVREVVARVRDFRYAAVLSKSLTQSGS
jgi:hypothetical protein